MDTRHRGKTSGDLLGLVVPVAAVYERWVKVALIRRSWEQFQLRELE